LDLSSEDSFVRFLEFWKVVEELRETRNVAKIGVCGLTTERLEQLCSGSKIDVVYISRAASKQEINTNVNMGLQHGFKVLKRLGGFPICHNCGDTKVDWIARYSLVAPSNSVLVSRGYISQHCARKGNK
jgi:hypothetical protein